MTTPLFIEGEYFGEVPEYLARYKEDRTFPRSRGWCCESCGRMWAAAPRVGKLWFFIVSCCGKCTSVWRTPGSILDPGDSEFNSLLPRRALEREFFIHLKAKELDQCPSSSKSSTNTPQMVVTAS